MKRSFMNIGITGVRGFIGSYLARQLLDRREGVVRLLVRSEAVRATREPLAGLEFAETCGGDLASIADCARFAKSLDVIYYLAHTNSPVNSDDDQAADVLANQIPLLNLISAARRSGTRPHIVYFSSGGAVYQRQPCKVPYTETDPCSPLSSYGIQKLAAEHYLRLAAMKGYLTVTVLRVGNVYGTLLPRQRLQGLIGVAINSVLHDSPVKVFGDPANVRDYIHLEDLCNLAVLASRPTSEFSIVNVGSGIGHSVTDILRLIEASYGSTIRIEVDMSRGQWLSDWFVLNTAKAAQEFGWSPARDLPSSVLGTITKWKEDAKELAVAG